MSTKQLYIGINGLAGSGKDTVAKMLKVILSGNWSSLEDAKEFYKSIYKNPTQSATYNPNPTNQEFEDNSPVLCIAYADQLKQICSTIFGIPLERFYMNKSNAWICINKDFAYTEIKPNEDSIITAEEFYYAKCEYTNSESKYWMSLREILVYVGTYVLQEDINKSIFINIVRNKVKETISVHPNISYVIVTDNRFLHEMDYIKEMNGITIKVVRDSIEQLPNIAEQQLDDENLFDYVVENNEGYNELFYQIWSLVHCDLEFSNETISLMTRDNVNNYLRKVWQNNKITKYLLCTSLNIQNIYKTDGEISMINPAGGPVISVDTPIPGAYTTSGNPVIPRNIEFDQDFNKFLIEILN
jgi:hypothetical protein